MGGVNLNFSEIEETLERRNHICPKNMGENVKEGRG
jgi:hypothetical protein